MTKFNVMGDEQLLHRPELDYNPKASEYSISHFVPVGSSVSCGSSVISYRMDNARDVTWLDFRQMTPSVRYSNTLEIASPLGVSRYRITDIIDKHLVTLSILSTPPPIISPEPEGSPRRPEPPVNVYCVSTGTLRRLLARASALGIGQRPPLLYMSSDIEYAIGDMQFDARNNILSLNLGGQTYVMDSKDGRDFIDSRSIPLDAPVIVRRGSVSMPMNSSQFMLNRSPMFSLSRNKLLLGTSSISFNYNDVYAHSRTVNVMVSE